MCLVYGDNPDLGLCGKSPQSPQRSQRWGYYWKVEIGWCMAPHTFLRAQIGVSTTLCDFARASDVEWSVWFSDPIVSSLVVL